MTDFKAKRPNSRQSAYAASFDANSPTNLDDLLEGDSVSLPSGETKGLDAFLKKQLDDPNVPDWIKVEILKDLEAEPEPGYVPAVKTLSDGTPIIMRNVSVREDSETSIEEGDAYLNDIDEDGNENEELVNILFKDPNPPGTFNQVLKTVEELRSKARELNEAATLVDEARLKTNRPNLPTIEEVAARLQSIDYRMQAVELKMDIVTQGITSITNAQLAMTQALKAIGEAASGILANEASRPGPRAKRVPRRKNPVEAASPDTFGTLRADLDRIKILNDAVQGITEVPEEPRMRSILLPEDEDEDNDERAS